MSNTEINSVQNTNIHVYIEGETLPKMVHDFLGRCQQSFDDLKQFVGFVALTDQVVIVLPKIYPVDIAKKENVLQHARQLFQVLKKVSQIADRESVKLIEAYYPQLDNINDQVPASRLGLADALLKDWLEHGFWNSFHQVFGQSGHQMDWERTLLKSQPMITHSGSLYVDTQFRQRCRHDEHILTQIHQWIIQDMLQNFGWLLPNAPTFNRLSRIPKPRGAIRVLKRFLPKMFKNRDIRLIKMLIQFLEPELKGFSKHIDIYGTCGFHAIFEHCCQRLYDDQQELFPIVKSKVQWNWEGAPKNVCRDFWLNKGQKADVIVDLQDAIVSAVHSTDEQQKRLMILDAKYYHLLKLFKSASQISDKRIIGVPGVNDVRKQYFYQHLLELKYPNSTIKNALLFPIYDPERISVCRLGTVHFDIQDEARNTVEGTGEKSDLTKSLLLIGIDLVWLFDKYLRTLSQDVLQLKLDTWALWEKQI